MSSEIVSGTTELGDKFHEKTINGVRILVQMGLHGLWHGYHICKPRGPVWHRSFDTETSALEWLECHTEFGWRNPCLTPSCLGNQKESTSKSISLSNWKVHLTVDADGHLGIFVKHADGSEVIDCEADIGDEKEFAVRLTTKKIESEVYEPFDRSLEADEWGR